MHNQNDDSWIGGLFIVILWVLAFVSIIIHESQAHDFLLKEAAMNVEMRVSDVSQYSEEDAVKVTLTSTAHAPSKFVDAGTVTSTLRDIALKMPVDQAQDYPIGKRINVELLFSLPD